MCARFRLSLFSRLGGPSRPLQTSLENSKANLLARQRADVDKRATELLGDVVVTTIRGTEVQAKVLKRNGPNLCLELGDGSHTWMHVEEVKKAGFEAWLLAGLGASSLPPPPNAGPGSPRRPIVSMTMSPALGEKLYARVFEPDSPSIKCPPIRISPRVPIDPEGSENCANAAPSSFDS